MERSSVFRNNNGLLASLMSTYEESRQKVLDALSQGDAHAAFQAIRPVLAYPGPIDDRKRWQDAWELFAQVGAKIAGDTFENLVRDVVQDWDNVQALYDLGYELVEQRLADMGATVLARAHRLLPGNENILTEFVMALEMEMRPQEACRVLRAAAALQQSNFHCQYLLAYHSMLTADLDGARRLLPRLRLETNTDARFMTQRIEGMLQRADLIKGTTPLDERDLRGWHFVLNGGLLLHLSPHGLDDPMRGRYAWVQDDVRRCQEGIRRLSAILDAWKMRPTCVFALAEVDSRALAIACAELLRCPLKDWPAAGADEPGLIPVYDLHNLDVEMLESLFAHRPGQMLWNHACPWTADPPFTGDFTTYLYQYNGSPWSEQLRVKPDGSGTETVPASEASAEERAGEIVAAQLEDEALLDLPALLALAKKISELRNGHAAGALLSTGPRRRQCLGSPVPSNRFA